jgi:hypothetical protein
MAAIIFSVSGFPLYRAFFLTAASPQKVSRSRGPPVASSISPSMGGSPTKRSGVDFDDAGLFLYCCNRRGGNVAGFRVNRTTGGGTFAGRDTAVGDALVIIFGSAYCRLPLRERSAEGTPLSRSERRLIGRSQSTMNPWHRPR